MPTVQEALAAARAKAQAATGSTDGSAASTTPGSATGTAAVAGSAAGTSVPGKRGRKPGTGVGRKKKEKVVVDRVKVDEAWMTNLTTLVNDHFQYKLAEIGAASNVAPPTISFAIAKNKGTPVSLTPRLIYADSSVQSPGPKGRLGFCTDKKFDEWYVKVWEKLSTAIVRKPRVRGAAPVKSTFWTESAESLKAALPEGVDLKILGNRLSFVQKGVDGAADTPIISFKPEDGKVLITSAKGESATIKNLMEIVQSTIK